MREGQCSRAQQLTRLVKFSALFYETLLGLVRLLQGAVELVVLHVEAFQALVPDELLQHLLAHTQSAPLAAQHELAHGGRPTSWKSLSSDSNAPASKPGVSFFPSTCAQGTMRE